MWELNNRTPFAVDRCWTRDKQGAHLWLVAVKATFDVGEQGKLRLSDQQLPVLLAPEHWGDPATTSVRFDADLTPPKPTTDLLVQGTAYAPQGKPATRVAVGLRAPGVDKTLIAYGPRVYYVGVFSAVSTSEALPFEQLPLRYEHAYGGSDLAAPDPRDQRHDARNPVGRGVARDPRTLHHREAHRVEYGAGRYDKVGPAGFGPLDVHWSPRRERLGTYDEAWERTRKPLLAADYDERTLQSAPDDQRPDALYHGGEPVLLTNLTPSGTLLFELPKVYLTFTSLFALRAEEHRARLGTVLVLPDEGKLVLVWQTALRVGLRDVDHLDRTVIGEKPYLP